jgi:predicted nucleic-acid-binding protein
MIAVDTNVLVRTLIDDPEEKGQVVRARARIRRAGKIYVPQIVQVETAWVLESAYGLDRQAMIAVFDGLLANGACTLQNRDTLEKALVAFREGRADLSDNMILAESQARGCELVTFDKRLQKIPGAVAV